MYYAFGRYRFYPDRRELFRVSRFKFFSAKKEKVPLPPKIAEALEFFLENRGRIVRHPELWQKLWPDVNVEKGSLAKLIFDLRAAFGKDTYGADYIENLPARGYRFRAKVRTVEEAHARTLLWRLYVPVGTVFAAILLILLRLMLRPGTAEGPIPIQLTNNQFTVPILSAAISPDGNDLAYTDGSGLYRQKTGTRDPVQLTGLPLAKYSGVSWFPDGTRLLVAGAVKPGDATSLWTVSTQGQAVRKLRDHTERGAISQDSSQIAFVDADGEHIGIMDPNGENPHFILDGQQGDTFNEVAWSTDGKWLVLGRLRLAASFQSEVTIESISPNGGNVQPLVSNAALRGMCTAPGDRIIYALAGPPPRENDSTLWEMPMDRLTGRKGGREQKIAILLDSRIRSLSLSSDGRRLAFIKGPYQADVYIGELSDQARRLSGVNPLTLDEGNHLPTGWTLDGKAVYFHSDRRGNYEIYKQALNQRVPQLIVGGPRDYRGGRLTPDGRRLLYFDRPKGKSTFSWSAPTRLMAVPLDGGGDAAGPAVKLVQEHIPFSARCAQDSNNLCVLSERVGRDLIFFELNPLSGRGRELTRTSVGLSFDQFYWDVSPDGSRIAIVLGQKAEEGIIRVLSLKGHPPRDVAIERWSNFQSMDWSHDGKGWYVSSRSGSGAYLLYVDALNGSTHLLRSQPGSFETWGIPSRDGHFLAFLEWSSSGKVWMLELER